MTFDQVIAAIGSVIKKAFQQKFTGKIIIVFNWKNGGIGSASVNMEHPLTVPDPE